MSEFSKLTWLKRTNRHGFTGAEFRVLIAIFNHSGADGTNSHPGLKLLMAETGYGRTAVSEALTALQERGWITQTRKGSGTSGKTSVYELVPDAPSSTAGAVQPETVGSAAGADQPRRLVRWSGPSWSAGADSVVPLERTPTDPGSDPSRSDQGEVRYSPNHLEDQDETGLESRSLAVEGREPEGLVGLQPPIANGSMFDDPWASEPAWLAESAAREERAARYLQPATAGGSTADPWD